MNSYEIIKRALVELGGEAARFSLDQPEDIAHGDYSTNIAFSLAKHDAISPHAYAEKVIEGLQESLRDTVEKIEVAGVGFINFFLKDDVRTDEVELIASLGVKKEHLGEQTLVEYTPKLFQGISYRSLDGQHNRGVACSRLRDERIRCCASMLSI